MDMLIAISGSYITALILAKGSILNQWRQWLIGKTPWLQKVAMKGEAPPPHYLVCRLCLGALISACFSWYCGVNWFIVYGLSYFLATQEHS